MYIIIYLYSTFLLLRAKRSLSRGPWFISANQRHFACMETTPQLPYTTEYKHSNYGNSDSWKLGGLNSKEAYIRRFTVYLSRYQGESLHPSLNFFAHFPYFWKNILHFRKFLPISLNLKKNPIFVQFSYSPFLKYLTSLRAMFTQGRSFLMPGEGGEINLEI